MRTFDWDDYRKLAVELSKCNTNTDLGEAKLRTAVSRAYYSQFIKARYLFGSPDQAHMNLINQMQTSGTRLIKSAGLKLKTLHDMRIQADYEELFPHPNDSAEQALDLADDLSGILDTFHSK